MKNWSKHVLFCHKHSSLHYKDRVSMLRRTKVLRTLSNERTVSASLEMKQQTEAKLSTTSHQSACVMLSHAGRGSVVLFYTAVVVRQDRLRTGGFPSRDIMCFFFGADFDSVFANVNNGQRKLCRCLPQFSIVAS